MGLVRNPRTQYPREYERFFTQTSPQSGGIPSGIICMWSGLLANIPSGWVLCDGLNGTPNLLAKFIKGVATSATNPGTTGGAATHTHDVTGSAHTHGLSGHTHGLPATTGVNGGTQVVQSGTGVTVAAGTHNHGLGGSTDSGGSGTTESGGSWTVTSTSASSEPAYYALAYIMKL